jgi:ribonucleoside-diphosphate reductase alpha chain
MEIKVKKRNGKLEEFDVEKINKCVYRACAGIDGNNVSASEVILDAQLQLYDKITTKEIDEALIL